MSEECYVCFSPENKFDKKLNFVNSEICLCKGSIKLHQECYEKILENTNICGICKSKYKQILIYNDKGLAEITERKDNYHKVYTVDKHNKKQGMCKTYYVTSIPDNPKISGLIRGKKIKQIYSICNYKDDQLEGYYIEYYKPQANNYRNLLRGIISASTGSVYLECNFINGVIEGSCKYYYKIDIEDKKRIPLRTRGQICEIYNYKNGLLDGESKEYYRNGILACSKNYKNDLLHGWYEEFDEKGKIILKGSYYENVKIGDWKIFNIPN